MERKFPFTSWRLLPSPAPAKVTLVEMRGSTCFGTYLISDKGKYFKASDIFESADAAIKEGFARLTAQEDHIAKLQAVVAKKRAALLKAKTALCALDGGK